MKDLVDFVLAFGMLATGSVNSIVTKFADSVCQRNIGALSISPSARLSFC